jgi:WD40 repeat protein
MLPLETGEQDQLDLGLLLAVEAVQYLESEGIPVSFDARNSLFNGLVVQPYFVAPIQIEPTLAATTPAAGSSTAASVSDAPVAISGDSRFIATTDGHGRVVLASLPTPSIAPSVSALSYLPQSETQGTGSVTALALSLANVQGAALLAVGEADGAIGVWDVSNPFTPEPLTTFAPRVVDSNCDLDEANPPPLATVSSVDVAVTSLTFDQGGLLAAGYGDGIVGLWDVTNVQDPQPPLMLRPSTEDADCGSGVLNLIFNPADGSNQLIAGYTDGSILSWGDPREDQEIVSLDSLSEGNGDQETARVHYLSRGISVDALALSPDGRFLAFGGQNGLFLRHLGTDQLLQPSAQPVTGLAFNSLDATTLFSSHENGGIVRWNVPRATIADDPRIRAVLSEATEHAVFEIATTPDSRWLVSRAADGRAVLWNPLGMPPIAQSVSGPLPAHTSCVASLVFDAEASVLVSVGGDGTEAPWDLNRIPTTPVPASAPSTLGTPLIQGPVPGVQPSVSSPQSRPPGVSTPESGAAATRSCAERDHLTPSNLESFGLDPEAIGTGIISIDQSHDGNLLAAGRENGEIVIWEDIDGEWELLGPLPGHLSAVTSLSFEGDERYLASGDANGWVVVWNLQTDEWIDFALTRAGRTLTCEEIRDDLNRNPPEEWEPTCQQTTE